jgi:hypothetical protein
MNKHEISVNALVFRAAAILVLLLGAAISVFAA